MSETRIKYRALRNWAANCVVTVLAFVSTAFAEGVAEKDDAGIFIPPYVLSPSRPVSGEELQARLEFRGYGIVTGAPQRAGEFSVKKPEWSIMRRPFLGERNKLFGALSVVIDTEQNTFRNKLGPDPKEIVLEPVKIADLDGAEFSEQFPELAFYSTHVIGAVLTDMEDGPIDLTNKRVYSSIDENFQSCVEQSLGSNLNSQKVKRALDGAPQGAILILDLANGAVRAWGSGDGVNVSSVDLITTPFPRGSIIKPFVYLTALDSSLSGGTALHPFENILDDSSAIAQGNNYENTFRFAVENLTGSGASELAKRIGAEQVKKTLQAFGITPESDKVSLADITRAFAVLGRGGETVSIQFYKSIQDLLGAVETPAKRTDVEVRISAAAPTYILTDMLRGVARYGEGAKLSDGVKGNQAVVLATTGDKRHSWSVGYTPRFAIGVYVGAGSGNGALSVDGVGYKIWNDTLRCAPDLGRGDFAIPAGVQVVRIARGSNRLASTACSDAEVDEEAFLTGTEPQERCQKNSPVEKRIVVPESTPEEAKRVTPENRPRPDAPVRPRPRQRRGTTVDSILNRLHRGVENIWR